MCAFRLGGLLAHSHHECRRGPDRKGYPGVSCQRPVFPAVEVGLDCKEPCIHGAQKGARNHVCNDFESPSQENPRMNDASSLQNDFIEITDSRSR